MTRKWLRGFLASMFLMLPFLAHADYAKITTIRVTKTALATRLIFTFNTFSLPTTFSLTRPERIILDFHEVKLGVNVNKLQFNHPAIKGMRYGFPKPVLLRLVIDVNQPMCYKIIPQQQTNQLILDIFTPTLSTTARTLLPVSSPGAGGINTLFTIAIDPGHGGKDPGTIGKRGTREKDVVLAIARQLANLIKQDPTLRVVLTRQSDHFVSLRNRLKLAQKNKADLFVSIHADSYSDEQSSGASVYALSRHGATTEAARWLARRENYSELGNGGVNELADRSYLVRSVLIDLAQTATIKDSLRLGSIVLDELDDTTKLRDKRVEQAPFVVLKSPAIPSILVETGYLSNYEEELRLRDPRYQLKIAQALFKSIHRYLKKYV